jgi:hypothetical protein
LLHNTRERALAEADGELLISRIKLQSVELARAVSLHFNVKADFGSHVTQLGLPEASAAAKVPRVAAAKSLAHHLCAWQPK